MECVITSEMISSIFPIKNKLSKIQKQLIDDILSCIIFFNDIGSLNNTDAPSLNNIISTGISKCRFFTIENSEFNKRSTLIGTVDKICDYALEKLDAPVDYIYFYRITPEAMIGCTILEMDEKIQNGENISKKYFLSSKLFDGISAIRVDTSFSVEYVGNSIESKKKETKGNYEENKWHCICCYNSLLSNFRIIFDKKPKNFVIYPFCLSLNLRKLLSSNT